MCNQNIVSHTLTQTHTHTLSFSALVSVMDGESVVARSCIQLTNCPSPIRERDNAMIFEKHATGRGWLKRGSRDGGKLREKMGEFRENYISQGSQATEVWMSCSYARLLCLREIRDIWDVFLAMTLLHGGRRGFASCAPRHGHPQGQTLRGG